MTVTDTTRVLTGTELANKYGGLCDGANDEGDDE